MHTARLVSSVRRASSTAVHRWPVELRILPKERAYSVVVPRPVSTKSKTSRRRARTLGRAEACCRPPTRPNRRRRQRAPDELLTSLRLRRRGRRDLQDRMRFLHPTGALAAEPSWCSTLGAGARCRIAGHQPVGERTDRGGLRIDEIGARLHATEVLTTRSLRLIVAALELFSAARAWPVPP
jgi:hypothetical protein